MELTEQKSLQWDADRIMEQLIMQESRHMQMSALVSYQLQYPDMTIRDFFAMASKELEEQEEELGYYELTHQTQGNRELTKRLIFS